jgi:predicted secreted protein
MRIRRIAAALAAGSAAVLLSAGPAFAAEAPPEGSGRVVKLPETVGDHLALAKEYEEKAAAWRKEADYHREMAAAYKKERPDFKGGARNPWTVRMEKHCEKISTDAERLAKDAEESARYHRLRAKELEGK